MSGKFRVPGYDPGKMGDFHVMPLTCGSSLLESGARLRRFLDLGEETRSVPMPAGMSLDFILLNL